MDNRPRGFIPTPEPMASKPFRKKPVENNSCPHVRRSGRTAFNKFVEDSMLHGKETPTTKRRENRPPKNN